MILVDMRVRAHVFVYVYMCVHACEYVNVCMCVRTCVYATRRRSGCIFMCVNRGRGLCVLDYMVQRGETRYACVYHVRPGQDDMRAFSR